MFGFSYYLLLPLARGTSGNEYSSSAPLLPTPLASDTGDVGKGLDIQISANGSYRKMNKDGKAWTARLSHVIYRMPEDKVNCSAGAREGGLGHAERKGLGTPATRAAILEKLVQMGFVQRKGKQLVPTKDGINLAVVLPESLTSPALTAEWENRLTEIAKGNADADEFMAEIEAQVRQLVKTYSCISADKQNLFQSKRVIIGKCPRCSENVYEGKKNFYCGNRSCQFVMWKNDRFFEQRKKAFTPKIAAALLKNGKAKVKGLYSEKTGKTYDATVLLADTGGKYVNYRVERKE